jgi:hypothetical protein
VFGACGYGPYTFRTLRKNARGLRAGAHIAALGGLRARREGRATVPTTTKLTPGETRDRLQELLKVATEYGAAESEMKRLAQELGEREDDWTEDLPHFTDAVHYEIRGALAQVMGESDKDALGICQEIQDAIDVLTFALDRDDRKGDDDAS